MDTYFENTLFLDTHLIGEGLNQIDKSNGGSLNYWFGGLMLITTQTCYDIQYLNMCLTRYMDSPT